MSVTWGHMNYIYFALICFILFVFLYDTLMIVVEATETCLFVCLFWARKLPMGQASSFTRFLNHTQRRTTFGRTPLDEWSARRRDFYLTTHNTHNTQTSRPTVRFEPTIPASERPQTHATETCRWIVIYDKMKYIFISVHFWCVT
jgi:hypothetical protein